MNQIYRAIGTSKQNVHQRLERQRALAEQQALLLPLMHQIRIDHPAMGAKMLYEKLQPAGMGRDQFIEFYNLCGFKLQPARNWRKTTNSNGVIRFPNHLAGRELTGVNQAFVSDITYYEIAGCFYYLTFITDVYSRKIKGYGASRSLKTRCTTLPALRQLLATKPEGKAIFHSDGGGQYYCKEFLKLTRGHFINSMGESAYENPHAERINGTIKNDYVRHYGPQNFRELLRLLSKAVTNYNEYRPHQSLDNYTPQQVEDGAYTYILKMKNITEELNPVNPNQTLNQTSKTVNLI